MSCSSSCTEVGNDNKDSKMVVLRSSDGETFEVSETVALESQTIKLMIEDTSEKKKFLNVDVTSSILALVIQYCKRHVLTDNTAADLKKFDADFVNVDQTILFDIVKAANYLNIKSLLDLTCQTIAEMIKGKTPEQIKKHFNITDDFTPEEEEEVRRDYARLFG